MTTAEQKLYEANKKTIELAESNDSNDEAQPWWDAFSQTPYIINISVISIPWSILGALLIIWDLVQNIYFNQGWAGVNPFLIANSIYGVLQYIMSIFVVWEIDPVL